MSAARPGVRSRGAAALIAAAALAMMAGCAGAGSRRSGPTLWRLTETSQIGGHTPRSYGSPTPVRDGSATVLRFDGVDDGFVVPVNPIAGWSRFTIEARIRPAAGGPAEQRFLHADDGAGSRDRVLLETRMLDGGTTWALDGYLRSGAIERILIDFERRHPADRWAWVALVCDGTRVAAYVNGELQREGPIAFVPMKAPGRISLGVRLTEQFWFAGEIAEVRFHEAALASGDLQRE